MAEKKENNGGAAEKKKGDIEGKKKKKKEEGGAVVLKIDMHCEGCASKITKYAKSVQGVEKAKVEWEASKLIVEGKVDPSMLLDKLQHKTKKKIQLVSPPPNKPDDDNTADNNKNVEEKKEKTEEKKQPKEPPVTTAVLKLGLHCHGCVDKIHKLVSKTTGVQSVTVEMHKDLVTVTGTMDAAALAETLKTKMKRVVEVVPQKKNKEKDHNKEAAAAAAGNKDNNKDKGKEKLEKEKESGDNGDEVNEKENGGNGGGGGGGGGKKKKKGGGGGGGGKEVKDENGGECNNGGCGKIMQGNRMEYIGPTGFANTGFYGYENPPPPANPFGYGYANANGAVGFYGNATPCSGYVYASGYGQMYADPYHAPQMFSDENPNACSIM